MAIREGKILLDCYELYQVSLLETSVGYPDLEGLLASYYRISELLLDFSVM